MSNPTDYIRSLYVSNTPEASNILKEIENAGMPMISVSPEAGKLMTMLIRSAGCRNALEIGALGGYSGLHILRGLEDDGMLTSLELKHEFADLAKKNLEDAGFKNRIRYKIGPALETLTEIEKQNETFDCFFIDADKENYTHYLDSAVRLASPGALIFADNTLWKGGVYDPTDQSETTNTLRDFNRKVAEHDQLEAMLIPIGDGMTLARVKS